MLGFMTCVLLSMVALSHQQFYGTYPSTAYSSQPQTVLLTSPVTTTQSDSPQPTIPTTFQASLPTLFTSSPAQHLTNFMQTFFPHIRPVAGTTTPGTLPTTYYYTQPQDATQGTTTGTTATGQQVLYYYFYPQNTAATTATTATQPVTATQLASRNAAYSYTTPTLQQQQPNTFTYYIHPATYYQPQTTTV